MDGAMRHNVFGRASWTGRYVVLQRTNGRPAGLEAALARGCFYSSFTTDFGSHRTGPIQPPALRSTVAKSGTYEYNQKMGGRPTFGRCARTLRVSRTIRIWMHGTPFRINGLQIVLDKGPFSCHCWKCRGRAMRRASPDRRFRLGPPAARSEWRERCL